VEPALVAVEICPQAIRRASWFEATVTSFEEQAGWVVSCTVEGLDTGGSTVFRGWIHAGNYSGGIELAPGRSVTFRWFTSDDDGGLVMAPASAVSFQGACEPWDWGGGGPPTCLAAGTEVATPSGPIAVEDVRVGSVVWSLDALGGRIAVPVLRVSHPAAPPGHEVVRLKLSDGRTLEASPGHPLSDGRLLGSLRVGDVVDGTTVVSALLIPYGERFTFDLLPAGSTGAYLANGIALLSTLRERQGSRD
jgi:hypothetical protein